MNETTAKAITACLETDVDFYRELTVFLMKKHTKVLEDDIDWLSDSLNDEQAYLMRSRSLEDKRLAIFAELGISGKKLSELIEEAPESYRPKMKMLGAQLTELIDKIGELNTETNELVKRKLDNQKDLVRQAGILNKPSTYNKNAAKVAGGASSAQVIRQI